MTYSLNSTQARNHARANLTIFDEVNSVMREVMVASDNGEYSVTVNDNTTMTASTPTIVITGTLTNPTISGGETLIIGGNTITLGTTGNNLNSIIADINDENIPQLTASKDSASRLVLTWETTDQNWQLIVGAGTANAALGITDGIVPANTPTSVTYYNVWRGTVTDRKMDDEIERVSSYFNNLGYNIAIVENPNTENTFQWVVNW